MPSGFQQDNNQLSPAFFRVVINMNNTDDSTQWYDQADDTSETTTGRITTWAWDNARTSTSRLPQTQVIADALARGNLRFQAIVDMLGLFADCQILDIENSGNDNAEDQVNQEQIAFTVKYDRDEFLFPAWIKYAESVDRGTDGAATTTVDNVTYPAYWSDFDEYTIVNQAGVIKELVTMGAARNNYTKSVRVFAPVEGADPMTGEGIQRVIEIDRPADNGGYIFRNITVTPIDGTTTNVDYD